LDLLQGTVQILHRANRKPADFLALSSWHCSCGGLRRSWTRWFRPSCSAF